MVEGILLMADDYSEGQELFFFFFLMWGRWLVHIRQSTELCGGKGSGEERWPGTQVSSVAKQIGT